MSTGSKELLKYNLNLTEPSDFLTYKFLGSTTSSYYTKVALREWCFLMAYTTLTYLLVASWGVQLVGSILPTVLLPNSLQAVLLDILIFLIIVLGQTLTVGRSMALLLGFIKTMTLIGLAKSTNSGGEESSLNET